jgi:putative toxin-antitoxin system antitoxin component (TIGR02293 family)
LIEQIWKSARNQVDQSHIEPLRQELDTAILANQSLQENHNELIKKLDESVSQNAALNQQIADIQVQNQSVINRFEESQASLHRLQSNAQQAQIEHQQKLSILVDTYAKERQEFQAEHLAALEEARKTMESVESRASNERNSLLLRMDRVGQELIQSRQQLTKLQISYEQLKEENSQTKIELVTKVAAEEQFRNKSVGLEYRLTELQTINTTLSEANTTLQGKLLVLLENMQELNAIQQHQQSGKVVRLTKAIELAVDVFEGNNAAISWLQSPNASFGGSSPLSLLDTDLGALSVMQTLGRIKDGVFN